MVAKPDIETVRLVIATDWTDPQVQAAIDDAALLVEGCPVIEAMSEDRQKAIVKWAAAHLIHAAGGGGQQLTSKKLGDAQEVYSSGQLGTQFESSYYGQQALLLDTSGCLATLGKRRAYFVHCTDVEDLER